MLFLLKYSLKNLLRSYARSSILCVGLSTSFILIVWLLSFNYSAQKQMTQEVTQQFIGYAQLFHQEYYNQDYSEINPYRVLKIDPTKYHEASNVCGRLTIPTFISGPQNMAGLLLIGLDPQKELQNSSIHKMIAQGTFLNEDDANNIIIGKRLSKKLGVQQGDELVVLGQALDGSIANDLFTVSAIIDFGGGDLEERVAFTNLASGRNFLSMPADTFHQLVSFQSTDSLLPFNETQSKIDNWQQLLPDVALSMRFTSSFCWLLSVVIVLIVGAGVANAFFLSFAEREDEIKSLNIIGIPSSWITLSLGIESLCLTLFSLFIGNILAWLIVTYFSIHPLDMMFMTGGQPILLGGMEISSAVSFIHYPLFYLVANIIIISFTSLAMVYPIWSAVKRSKHVA